MFYNFCRNSSNNHIIWYILNYNGICSNYNIITNIYTPNNFCPTTDSYIISDYWLFRSVKTNCNLLVYMAIFTYLFSINNCRETMLNDESPPMSVVQI